MTQLEIMTVVGVVVLAILIWIYFRLRSKDHVEQVLAKHKAAGRVCSRACLLEGMEQIPVALALTPDSINYENRDLQASIDLSVIEEVEYDDETATGHTIAGKVLRLRAHNHVFEFTLDLPSAKQWETALPARRVDRGADHAKAV
ncbi:MAG TPA: hypothetical protein VGQ21_09120 [Thermoanaerobaculia bacterium]|jgi:hypothetical protein|nr:hypothetical protein [Thermoanaerobaculia bacterium]